MLLSEFVGIFSIFPQIGMGLVDLPTPWVFLPVANTKKMRMRTAYKRNVLFLALILHECNRPEYDVRLLRRLHTLRLESSVEYGIVQRAEAGPTYVD